MCCDKEACQARATHPAKHPQFPWYEGMDIDNLNLPRRREFVPFNNLRLVLNTHPHLRTTPTMKLNLVLLSLAASTLAMPAPKEAAQLRPRQTLLSSIQQAGGLHSIVTKIPEYIHIVGLTDKLPHER